jgi:uncharacterized GH25 family protein
MIFEKNVTYCSGLNRGRAVLRRQLVFFAHDIQHLASVFCGGDLSQAHLGYSYDQKANDTEQASSNKSKQNIRFAHRDETSDYAQRNERPPKSKGERNTARYNYGELTPALASLEFI